MPTSLSSRLSPNDLVSSTVFRSFVNGQTLEESESTVELHDPATGRVWGTAFTTTGSVNAAVTSAQDAYLRSGWSAWAGWQRAEKLNKLADLILENSAELAALETLATGKPLTATKAEIAAGTRWYRYYAAAVETARDAYIALGPSKDAAIRSEPIGVVAAITPFNGAFSLGSWKIAPALAVGNTVVVKPPVLAAGSTLLLAKLALEAGIPPGVLNVVVGDVSEGHELASDPRVGLLTFTGSTSVAQRIGSVVSGRLGRFICEAGGKSAHIVMDDADLESAVIAATQGVFSGSGQTCVAGSRLLIHARIFDEFIDRFTAHAAKLIVGDPLDPSTHLGPIATAKQRESILGFIDRAIANGAKRQIGGSATPTDEALRQGYWVAPTILTNVTPEMEICREEVFGPVVAVQKISSLDEALHIANSSQYGLAAGIWTTNQASAHRAAKSLQAGTVWINTYRGMDWRTPFGGYKQSGIGRENGLEALQEFSQVKTVVQDFAPAMDPFNLA